MTYFFPYGHRNTNFKKTPGKCSSPLAAVRAIEVVAPSLLSDTVHDYLAISIMDYISAIQVWSTDKAAPAFPAGL